MSGESTNTGNTGTEPTSGASLNAGVLIGLYFPYGIRDGWNDQAHRGCSSEFGTGQIDTGSMLYPVPYNGSNQVDVMVPYSDTNEITWSATPKAGFVFDCWYNIDDPTSPIRTGTSSTNSIRYTANSPRILVPSFAPSRPVFNRPISITVKGQDLSEAVEVSSMLTYYDYLLDSSVTGSTTSYRFNGTSPKVLPDNQPITLKVRSVNGYSISVKVNGTPVAAQVEQSSSSNTNTGTTSQTNDRGGSETSGGSDERIPESVKTYTITNTGTTNMQILVEYTSTAREYTLKVEKVPSAARENKVYAHSDGEEPSTNVQQITVAEGTTVHACADPGTRYSFLHWMTDPNTVSSVVSADRDYRFTISDDITLYGVFTENYTTIDAIATTGGTTHIYVGGTEHTGPIRSDLYSGQDILLVAEANQDYTFIQWRLNGEEFQGNNQSSIRVEFGATDKVYTAVFSYTPVGLAPFVAHTIATTDGTTITDSTSDTSVSFNLKYTNRTGSTIGIDQITNTERSFESMVENSGGVYSATIVLDNNLTIPTIVTEGTQKYRYEFQNFAYKTYGDSSSQISRWSTIVLDEQNRWTLEFPNYSGGRIDPTEVAAVYLKTPVYEVKLETITEAGQNPSYNIWTTGGGNHPAGSTVPINTGLNDGVDENRYEFVKWIDTVTGELFSSSQSHSFVVNADTNLTAVYQERCSLVCSSNNDELGTVSVVTEPDPNLPEGWWPSNTAVEIRAVDGTGVFDHWSTSTGSPTQNPITIRVSTDPTTITGVFVESIKTLKVNATEGGSVTIQTQELGETEWRTAYPMEGTVGTYSIPNGCSVRAIATPEFGYSFRGYVMYDDGGSEPTEYSGRTFEIGLILADKILNASFEYVPWISKLTSIMKVY